jgi:hypothetical protein
MICIGAVFTLLFCAIFSVKNTVLHCLLCALVALTISLIVILILATDHSTGPRASRPSRCNTCSIPVSATGRRRPSWS